MKHFNDHTDDDTYDGKLTSKISGIRMMFSRLGNTVTNKDRQKITTELYETEKKKNLSDKQKGKIYDHLVELVNTFNKKEEYKYHDRDDLDYYEIFLIMIMIMMIIIANQYQSKVVLKIVINIMKSEVIKTKNSVKQYLYKILTHLRDLINNHKDLKNIKFKKI